MSKNLGLRTRNMTKAARILLERDRLAGAISWLFAFKGVEKT